MKKWNMIHKIKVYYNDGEGESIRSIAKKLQISKNTVKKYLRMNEEEISRYLKHSKRYKILDTHQDMIKDLLQKYPLMSGVKVRKKLDDLGLDAEVSNRTIRRYIKVLKEKYPTRQKRYYEPVSELLPGLQCQVDPGELRDVLIGGKLKPVYFTVFVLSYSRLMYVGVSFKPINTETFLSMHDEAFSYFGGVPLECVYDQTKLVALKEEFREVWFNDRFYQYATTVNFDVRVCEGYDPESKGKVESGVKYVKNNCFYGEEFSDTHQVRKEVFRWLEETANCRNHATTLRAPKEDYERVERKQMRPYLRPQKLLIAQIGETRKADKTSLISYKSNKYSVPMAYQETTVEIRIKGVKLHIFDLGSHLEIACHRLSENKGETFKNNNHYRDHSLELIDHEKTVIELLGQEQGRKICSLLKLTSPRIYRDQLTGLMAVCRNYDSDKLEVPFNELTSRHNLKVSQIRDYLESHFLSVNKPPLKIEKGAAKSLSKYDFHQEGVSGAQEVEHAVS